MLPEKLTIKGLVKNRIYIQYAFNLYIVFISFTINLITVKLHALIDYSELEVDRAHEYYHSKSIRE